MITSKRLGDNFAGGLRARKKLAGRQARATSSRRPRPPIASTRTLRAALSTLPAPWQDQERVRLTAIGRAYRDLGAARPCAAGFGVSAGVCQVSRRQAIETVEVFAILDGKDSLDSRRARICRRSRAYVRRRLSKLSKVSFSFYPIENKGKIERHPARHQKTVGRLGKPIKYSEAAGGR